jgi:AraC-like DNA-binding protein
VIAALIFALSSFCLSEAKDIGKNILYGTGTKTCAIRLLRHQLEVRKIFETDANGHDWLNIEYENLNDTFLSLETHFETIAYQAQKGRLVSGLKLRVPPEKGRGSWWVVRSSPGMNVMHLEAEYYRDEVVKVSGDHMAKARILLSGAIRYINADIKVEGTGAFLEAYPRDTASDYVIYAGSLTRLVIINAVPSVLTDRLGLDPEDVPRPLRRVFQDEAIEASGGIAALGPDILRSASDIFHASKTYHPKLFRPFLDAKSHELMCSIIQDLGRKRHQEDDGQGFSLREMRRVDEARVILIDSFDTPPRIPDLARKVGLNQTKLKAVFKAAYGMTIYNFILTQRMDRAAELLHGSDLSIAEVAFEVGYDYPASFTNAFVRYFGHSPRSYRAASKNTSLT